MYFVPESIANHPISPNLDLSFDNPLVRQMFMLHNTLGEAYPPNLMLQNGLWTADALII